MVLLEVNDKASSAGSTFLCELTVSVKVHAAIEHIAQLCRLRVALAASVNPASSSSLEEGSQSVGSKRPRDDEAAFTSAVALLSPVGVGRKTVLTSELLEKSLVAMGGQPPSLDLLPRGDVGLFFAGKWLEGDKPLSSYVGSNEKSKVKVVFGTVQPVGAGEEGGGGGGSSGPIAGTSTSGGGGGGAAGGDEGGQAGPVVTAAAVAAAAGAAPASMADAAAASHAPAGGACAARPEAASAVVSLSSFFRERVGGGPPSHRSRGGGGDAAEADAAVGDDDFPLLSSRQLEQLGTSSELRAACRDPRLQELLRHVDSAPTREGALKRLEGALQSDPDFEQFALAALRVIGCEPSAGASS
jgi:hypothetical protein